jgi:glycosyltransferase involved in cell wall biosynthesis
MRIGLIYDAAYPWVLGGGEKALYELALELRNRGHEVHLFTMQYWDDSRDIVRDGLHYHGVCPKMPLYDAEGRRSLKQPLRFGWGLFFSLRKYQLYRFDVVNIHAFPFYSVFAFWLAHAFFARRVPWVVTWLEVWGRDYWRNYLGRLGWVGATIEWLCARLAPAHHCISPTTAHRLNTLLGIRQKAIHIIPLGFDFPEDFCPEHAAKEPHKAVAIGRLLEYKRIDILIRAWPAVLDEVPDAVLHVIGGGPERHELERLTIAEGVGDTVRFMGEIFEKRLVWSEIESASLLLQPSAREGQSLVVVEAMAIGTAVLAATGPETAVGDFIGGGEDSQFSLVPVDAGPQDWSRRIVVLMKDPALQARLALHGHERADSLRWRESIAPKMEALYQSLAR